MRFYSQHHQFYAGIDLHARSIFICIIDEKGETRLHRNFPADTAHLHSALEPFMPDVLVGVECIFSWYWVSDFCEDHHLPFALGHALYMKAIHGGKTKNDKIDSHKIALMLRSGMFPSAYVYPRHMRAARDLLRRRQYFVHQQSELLAHIQITNMQYNLPDFEKNISYSANRTCLSDRFPDPDVQKSVEADVLLLDAYHRTLIDIEAQIKRRAVGHDPLSCQLLRSIPGVGPILSLVILYEIGDISRFPSVGQFISYARLVKCAHESAGKRVKGGGAKIGNSHLKWAFSEAAVLFLRKNEPAQRWKQSLSSKYGKAKALSLIAQKLARTAYYMLKRKEPYEEKKFFGDTLSEPAI